MDKPTADKLQGMRELLTDAVDAAVNETERAHTAIAHYPYAVLERITPIAAPVRAIEYVQKTITGIVYRTIRVATFAADRTAFHAVVALARDEDPAGEP